MGPIMTSPRVKKDPGEGQRSGKRGGRDRRRIQIELETDLLMVGRDELETFHTS